MSDEGNVESGRKRKKSDKKKKKDKELLHDVREGHAQQERGVTEKMLKDFSSSAQITKKKKRKHGDVADDKIENITDGDQPDKQRRKRRSKGHGEEELEDEGPKKHKTHSRRKKDDPAASDNGSESKRLTESSKKQKENVSSTLPDPAQDTTLTDKARSALTYAYTRLASPESWKFNKAHQNWIVKHLFTLDSVPGKYDSIVIGYLSGCQGAVRQSLIDACNKQLEPAAEDNAPSGTGATTEPPAVDNAEADNGRSSLEIHEMLGMRARSLLDTLARPST